MYSEITVWGVWKQISSSCSLQSYNKYKISGLVIYFGLMFLPEDPLFCQKSWKKGNFSTAVLVWNTHHEHMHMIFVKLLTVCAAPIISCHSLLRIYKMRHSADSGLSRLTVFPFCLQCTCSVPIGNNKQKYSDTFT